MKVSVFTTSTRPVERLDTYREAIASYQFADEVVEVTGDRAARQCETVRKYHAWPHEFDWRLIGEQFQRGYEACTGDWVIHADLDFLFHEQDTDAIRKAFQDNSEEPVLSFWKYQFILPDRYTLKSRLVIAVNKAKFGDRIRFDSGGDLCQPSLDGVELHPDKVLEARVPFYNYEKLIKTEEQIKDDVGRMARAWYREFGEYKLGGPTDESAYQEWLKMTVGRFNARSQQQIALRDHPAAIQETIASLRPHQWGFSGFGNLSVNRYADALESVVIEG